MKQVRNQKFLGPSLVLPRMELKWNLSRVVINVWENGFGCWLAPGHPSDWHSVVIGFNNVQYNIMWWGIGPSQLYVPYCKKDKPTHPYRKRALKHWLKRWLQSVRLVVLWGALRTNFKYQTNNSPSLFCFQFAWRLQWTMEIVVRLPVLYSTR